MDNRSVDDLLSFINGDNEGISFVHFMNVFLYVS